MNEDDRYRTSTQYRHWSYSPESLAALRATTNQLAAERVRIATRRLRETRAASSSASASASTSETEQNGSVSRSISTGPDGEIDCLTPAEELKLVTFYCRQTLELGDHLRVPTDVKATAVQYIKRFYITNSLMTYHATDIIKTALYFATKTENHYFRLTKFAEAIGKTKPEDVLASEFLLTQGLRFTFDVRHPYRALEGVVMELQAIAAGQIPALPGLPAVQPPPHIREFAKRVREIHGRAREYLKTSALLSDAYFHFTPSQIMLSSLLIGDEELATWYIETKMQSSPAAIQQKVKETLMACAAMLKTIAPMSQPSEAEFKELKALNKKLQKCRNPDKMDLVALNKAAKRDGGEDGLDEKTIKKRKLAREQSLKEAEDLFGPDIKK